MLQSFPLGVLQEMDQDGDFQAGPEDSLEGDLAGNAFAGNVVCVLLTILFTLLPWQRPDLRRQLLCTESWQCCAAPVLQA